MMCDTENVYKKYKIRAKLHWQTENNVEILLISLMLQVLVPRHF